MRPGRSHRKGHEVPIQNVPVDQEAFIKFMLISVEPKTDRDTGVQFTSKDGVESKWNVQVVAQLPSRWDSGRTESEVLSVTVTCAQDPSLQVEEGDKVWFEHLTVGVMNPEQDKDSGRIRGGKLFYGASGVMVRSLAVKS
jgi:hypothetical protein